MKKLVWMLLLWGSAGAFAQTKPDSLAPYRERAGYLLENLIATHPVASGILLDRVFPLSGIDGWKTDTAIGDTSSGIRMIQALSELEGAGGNPAPGMGLEEKTDGYFRKIRSLRLPTGVIRMDVQVLDTGKLGDSSLLMNSEGRLTFTGTGSPYETRRLSMASFLNPCPLRTGEIYQVEYPEIFSNIPEDAEPGQVRFRRSGQPWTVLQPGQTLPLSFPQEGNYLFDFEVIWKNGNRLVNRVLVTASASCDNPEEEMRPDDCSWWASQYPAACGNTGIPIQADIPFEGIAGRGEVYYYRRGNEVNCDLNAVPLRNPIIFVDGIDFEDQRKGQAIFGKYIRYTDRQAGGPSGAAVLFGNQLRQAGHDLLILNFPDGHNPADVQAGKASPGIDGGCDFIERNAMILVKLIRQVRDNLAAHGHSADKIILAGPSMGGLICRYALAYMEKHEALTGPHSCRLYISQDAPHLGASIPLGIQFFIANTADQFGSAQSQRFLKRRLEVPATQELLLRHARVPGYGCHPLRNTFLQNQNQNGPNGKLGWPSAPDLAKVALHNGSLAGKAAFSTYPERITGGADMLRVSARLRHSPFMDYLIPNAGAVVAALPRCYWEVNYAPASNGEAPVFRQFWAMDMGLGRVYLGKTMVRTVRSFNSGVSLDAAPGGLYNAPAQTAGGIRSSLDGFMSMLIGLSMETAHQTATFIPVKSALAFRWNRGGLEDGERGPGISLATPLNDRNLVCTGETPFDDYLMLPPGADENTDHILLTREAAGLIMKHIQPPQPPPVISYTVQVAGPRLVLNGSRPAFTAQYTGNHDFLTTWEILQASGVTATLFNPYSRTCEVQVGSTAGGSSNGFVIVKALTQVRLPSGDIVCQGSVEHTFYVRHVPAMGSIGFTCSYIKQNCGPRYTIALPAQPPPGSDVSFIKVVWQISRYDEDAGYGASTFDGDLRLDVYGPQGALDQARVVLTRSMPNGSFYRMYIRACAEYRIPDPNPQAGRSPYIYFWTPWKKLLADLEVHPNCGTPGCTRMLAVLPERLEAGSGTGEISLISEDAPAGGRVTIFDMRNQPVRSFEALFPIRFSTANLAPARYRVVHESASGTTEAFFYVESQAGSRLAISPNPCIVGIDREAAVSLLPDDAGPVSTPVEYELRRFTGEVIASWSGGTETRAALTGLEPGTYVIRARYGQTTLEQDVNFILRGMPFLMVSPNPSADLARVQLMNPVYPDGEYGPPADPETTFEQVLPDAGPVERMLRYSLTRNGLVMLEGTENKTAFDLNLTSLPAGVYVLTVDDGMARYFRHAQVIR